MAQPVLGYRRLGKELGHPCARPLARAQYEPQELWQHAQILFAAVRKVGPRLPALVDGSSDNPDDAKPDWDIEPDQHIGPRETRLIRGRMAALEHPLVAGDNVENDGGLLRRTALDPARQPMHLAVHMIHGQSQPIAQLPRQGAFARAGGPYDHDPLHISQAHPTQPLKHFSPNGEFRLVSVARTDYTSIATNRRPGDPLCPRASVLPPSSAPWPGL